MLRCCHLRHTRNEYCAVVDHCYERLRIARIFFFMAETLAELRAREDEVGREWKWLVDTLNEVARFRHLARETPSKALSGLNLPGATFGQL